MNLYTNDISCLCCTCSSHACTCTCMFQKLPKVNKHLAERLLEESSALPGESSANAGAAQRTNPQNPIGDDRFAALFTNPDYEVDEASEEYQLLHPVLTHREKRRAKKKERHLQQQLEHLSMEAAQEEVYNMVCPIQNEFLTKPIYPESHHLYMNVYIL